MQDIDDKAESTEALTDPEAKEQSVVEEARERFARAEKYYNSARMLAIEDTKFALGDSDNGWQWPEDIRRARMDSKRVMLTINTTAQHCNQISNQIRQNRPAVKVSPSDNLAHKKTAEILGGLVRNILTASAADDAHDIAAEHAVMGGEGYWRVITEYESQTSHNHVIKVKQCPNPNLVFIDPDCLEMDKSDATWGFVFEDIGKEQCKRENPDIEPASWGNSHDGWYDADRIRRAEYYYCTWGDDVACLLQDGTTILKSALPEGSVVVKERKTKVKKWHWCKLIGGHDEPVDEEEWLGEYLPIIAVVGKEININGEVVRKGIVRDLKDPARTVNYAYSETVQTLALQNKVPYLASIESIAGHEKIWGSANLESRAYLPHNAYDKEGRPIPTPQRQPPAVMPDAQVHLLQLSLEQMRGVSGQQNANFGIRSEAQSGVGIQRLKVQGDIATFHFPDNLARALRYEAKVLIDLIQKYYDTARVVRILGIDGQESTAQLNPDMQQPYAEAPHPTDPNGDIQRIFNPLVGTYDVTIDTGPSFQTQRQEGAAALNELAGKNPALMQVAGDIVMRAQDFPMADQLADRLAKTLPPALQDAKPGAAPQIPPQVQAKIQEQGQVIQGLQAHMQEALKNVDGLNQQLAAAKSDQAIKAQELQIKQADVQVKQFQAETQRMQAAQAMQSAALVQQQAEREQMQQVSDSVGEAQHEAEEQARLDAMEQAMERMAQIIMAPKPAPPRREISITAPSGATYVGVVDGGDVTIRSPSGAEYHGQISESEKS